MNSNPITIRVEYDFEGTRADDMVIVSRAFSDAEGGGICTGILIGVAGPTILSELYPIEEQIDFLLYNKEYFEQQKKRK